MPEKSDLYNSGEQAWDSLYPLVSHLRKVRMFDLRIETRKVCRKMDIPVKQFLARIRETPKQADSPEGREILEAFKG